MNGAPSINRHLGSVHFDQLDPKIREKLARFEQEQNDDGDNSPEKSEFECGVCGEAYNSQTDIHNHLRDTHSITSQFSLHYK